MKSKLSQKTLKVISSIITALIILAFILIFIYVGKPLVSLLKDPAGFRDWIDDFGFLGRLIFIGMIFLQVSVAVIPGEPFEIAAGYAFGSIEGTLLCVAGIMIASAVIFSLVRKFGVKLVEVFFSLDRINSLKYLKDDKKRDTLFFILMLIPGTPKDLLCYFAGLTKMKLSSFLIISAIARIPSVITSTIGGSMLGEQKYIFAVLAFSITLLISVIGLLIYKKIEKSRNAE